MSSPAGECRHVSSFIWSSILSDLLKACAEMVPVFYHTSSLGGNLCMSLVELIAKERPMVFKTLKKAHAKRKEK